MLVDLVLNPIELALDFIIHTDFVPSMPNMQPNFYLESWNPTFYEHHKFVNLRPYIYAPSEQLKPTSVAPSKRNRDFLIRII